jgi:hypothetical protein
MRGRQINDLLQSKKREDLNRVPLGVFKARPEHRFPRLHLGHSGPEAQIELRRLALSSIEFVGARLRISEGMR